MSFPRVNLEREAVRITLELGRVVFVGALAVNHYTSFRTTRDIDLVIAGPLDGERLREVGYIKKQGSGNSWYTPRGIQADFYTRDVGGIPVDWILKTAVPVQVGREKIRVICLEGLILAKHRAGRPQDIADLRKLIINRSRKIKWEVMRQIGTELELAEMRSVVRAMAT